MCHEGIVNARTMGLPCCFTDHSLFGFADTSSILTNKLLKFTLSDVAQVICVSHTSKENTVLRAALDPAKVSVIPNAIEYPCFAPPKAVDPDGRLTVVVLSRLVYRKGMDLLVSLVPRICARFPAVDFLIAGDGPKKIDLEQMRERHDLYDRVELIGPVPARDVPKVLVRGQVFLNCSLTEAFCMAIVEAACCGLRVVSTSVGGVPEVLPDDIISLARPDEDDLCRALSAAIAAAFEDLKDPDALLRKMQEQHDRVSHMYEWGRVSARTELVYLKALEDARTPLIERMRRVYGAGEVAGKLFNVIVIVVYIQHCLLRLIS